MLVSYTGMYGIPRPWYFPFTRTYWCGEKQNTNVAGSEGDHGNAEGRQGSRGHDLSGRIHESSSKNGSPFFYSVYL